MATSFIRQMIKKKKKKKQFKLHRKPPANQQC